jgi:hypothetical protein
MALSHSPKVTTDGLVFYYDMNNSKKSWIGRPTTNHIASSSVIERYNNTGFSGARTNTGLTYKGAPIYELTFIPQDASYISKLGSTEGFGAFHTMGIPLQGNTTYMASIYMRSDHPLQAVSTEGFSNGYSNIGGWTQNSTVSTRYKEDGWTRLYSQFLNNQNGYAVRNVVFPNQYGNGTQFTVNTTSTQTIDVSVTVLADGTGIPDFPYLYALVAAAPSITVNGGLTGLTILDHGLDTTSYTKLSWPSNIRLKAQLPFTYYFRVSVPSTSGANVNISIASNFTSYTTAITDAKFWKVTFDTTNVAVGQVIKTYWCCPMLEQHNTVYPSTYINGTRSNTQALQDLIGGNTIDVNSATYNNDGSFTFNGTTDYLSSPTSINAKTVIAWVKLSTTAGGDYVVYGLDANGADNWFGINTNKVNLYGTQSSDVNNFALTGTTTLNATNYYQIAGIVDGQTAKVFLNGVQENSVTQVFTIAPWNTQPFIGTRGTLFQRFFPGIIASVLVYDRVLTNEEIRQNFNATRGRYGL